MAAFLGNPSAPLNLVVQAEGPLSWTWFSKQTLRRVSGSGRELPIRMTTTMSDRVALHQGTFGQKRSFEILWLY